MKIKNWKLKIYSFLNAIPKNLCYIHYQVS